MKIATININGLKNRKQELIKIINNNVLDLICTQEVHKIDQNEISDIEKETSGVLFSDTVSGYLGTEILIRVMSKIYNLNILKSIKQTLRID